MRLNFYFLVLLIFFSIGIDTSCQELTEEAGFILLSNEDFQNRYNSEVYALIIDARSAPEYRKSRIEGALNAGSRNDLSLMADTLDHETPLYLYCTTSTRSRSAAKNLIELGFVRLFVLEDGIRSWKKSGMPVDRKKIRRKK